MIHASNVTKNHFPISSDNTDRAFPSAEAILDNLETQSDLYELLRSVLRDHFQPALLAFFQTVIFRPLVQDVMRTIVGMKFDQVTAPSLILYMEITQCSRLSAKAIKPRTEVR